VTPNTDHNQDAPQPGKTPPCPSGPAWNYRGYHLETSNFVTAMVHLYRAEVSRTNLWRNRLDATTNWAVVTAGAALTFTFSSTQNPHFVLLLMLLFVLAFLNIEARRYSYYALWYYRVRLLETDFLATMNAPPFRPSPHWGDALSQTLSTPTLPISRLQAVGQRYRRNYFWLVTLLLLSWVLKLTLHPTPTHDLSEILTRAAVGPFIPGPWALGAVASIYCALLVLAITVTVPDASQGHPAGRRITKLLLRQYQPQEKLAIIITNCKDTLAERLMADLERGVTALEGTGMYTGKRRDVLLCAITDVQIPHLEAIIREADPDAFMMITEASDIRGGMFRPFEPPS